MKNIFRVLGRTLLAAAVMVLSIQVYAADELVVERKATINASTADVWEFVGGWDQINNLATAIEKVEIDGDEVGSMRTLTLPDGGTIKEQLTDKKEASYSYIFTESPLPVSDYGATIMVTETSDGKTEFTWVGKFKAVGVTDDEAKDIFTGIYEGGIDALMKKFP